MNTTISLRNPILQLSTSTFFDKESTGSRFTKGDDGGSLRDAHSDMQSGRHSRLSQIIQHIPTLTAGSNEYQEGMNLKELSLVGIANLSNDLLVNHPVLSTVNSDMEQILRKQILLKQDDIKTRFEVADSRSKDMQKINALLEKLDLVVDKNASSMQGKVGLVPAIF